MPHIFLRVTNEARLAIERLIIAAFGIIFAIGMLLGPILSLIGVIP